MIDIKSISIVDDQNTTGTQALVGSAGGRMTATIQFYIHWEIENASMDFSSNTISLNDVTASWIAENFQAGDIIEVVGTASNDGQYEVDGVPNQYDLVCSLTGSGSGSGSTTPFGDETGVTCSVYGVTPVTMINYYYNTIENASGVSYASILDGEIIKLSHKNNDFDATPTKALENIGINLSQYTGFSADFALNQVEYIGLGASGISTGYEQYFEITLVFYPNPVILQSYLDSSDLFDASLNPEFYQNNCLRFVNEIETSFDGSLFGHSSSQGNGASFNNVNGDTGWFNEEKNGVSSDYSLTSVSMVDAYGNTVTEIGYNSNTIVTAVITDANSNFTTGTNFELVLWEMPAETDYQNNINTMFTNFDVSRSYMSQTSSPSVSNNLNASVIASGATATIAAIVSADALNAGRKYALFVITQDVTSTDLSTSNIAEILIAQGERVDNIPTGDIFNTTDGLRLNEHPTNDTDLGYQNYEGWVEDDILGTMSFNIKRTTQDARNVSLSDVDWKVMAVHATDSTKDIILDSVNIPVNTNSTRGYAGLYSGDPKNYLKLSLESTTATYTYYKLQVGQFLGYEYWKSLLSANSDFPNGTENINEYQDHTDYTLKIWVDCNTLVGETPASDVTFRREANLSALDYEEYYDCEIIGEIQTFYEDDTPLGTSVSKTQNTKVKGVFTGKELFPCIYTPLGSGSGSCSFSESRSESNSDSYSEDAIDPDCYNFWGWIGLDNVFNGGRETIDVVSTEFDPNTNTAWIGESGDKAKIIQYPYATPPRIEIIATLDVSKIDTTLSKLKLSARIGKKNEALCDTALNVTLVADNSYQNNELVGKPSEEILVIFFGKEKITDNWTYDDGVDGIITMPDFFSGLMKICCAIDGFEDNLVADGKYTYAPLIGLTMDDFIVFASGIEQTTLTGASFDSGTGQITFATSLTSLMKISLHVALVSDTLSSDTDYTDASLIGRNFDDLLVFVEGVEYSTKTGTFDSATGTVTFGATLTGEMKIIEM